MQCFKQSDRACLTRFTRGSQRQNSAQEQKWLSRAHLPGGGPSAIRQKSHPLRGLGKGGARQTERGAALAGSSRGDSESGATPGGPHPSATSPRAVRARQVSVRAAGPAPAPAPAPRPSARARRELRPLPGKAGRSALEAALAPAQASHRHRGAGPEAGPGRRGGARAGAPCSAAASPAGLAAGELLGRVLGPHGSPRFPDRMRLHPDSPGPADPGAAGQLQLGAALRGQAEAGGEQQPRRPGGQEPADPGAGAADPGPEGPQLRGQRWVEPAGPWTAATPPPTLSPTPPSPSAPWCFHQLLPGGAGPGLLPTCCSPSLCMTHRASRFRPAYLRKALF